jgi:hypothetical protein
MSRICIYYVFMYKLCVIFMEKKYEKAMFYMGKILIKYPLLISWIYFFHIYFSYVLLM